MKIVQVIGRELFDAQGWPTIQCEILLDSGICVSALAPSGRSIGAYEAVELHDRDARFQGRGVHKALESIENIIAPILIGQEPRAFELDANLIQLDGTENKSRLGANTLLAVSMALYRAEAACHGMELFELFATLFDADFVTMPVPMLNVINGGLHADNGLSIQEFLIIPVNAPSFRTALEAGIITYHELGKALKTKGKSVSVGLEGGYASSFTSDIEALDILHEVINTVNSRYPITCMIGLDMAASQWYNKETQLYQFNHAHYTASELIQLYRELLQQYPLYSLEDPLHEDDWDNWRILTKNFGHQVQLIGDDLFATHVERIEYGADSESATGCVIKPNQIGTISETLQALALCKNRSLYPIISHRSADTEDTFIADLAVGTSAGQIKTGAPCRSERTAKYNRLLTIEEILIKESEQPLSL